MSARKQFFEYFKLNEVQEFENGIKTIKTNGDVIPEPFYHTNSAYAVEWVWIPSDLPEDDKKQLYSTTYLLHSKNCFKVMADRWFPISKAYDAGTSFYSIHDLVKKAAAKKEKDFFEAIQLKQIERKTKAAIKLGLTLKEYEVLQEENKQKRRSVKQTNGVIDVAPDISNARALFEKINTELGTKSKISGELYDRLIDFMRNIGTISKKLRKYHLVDK